MDRNPPSWIRIDSLADVKPWPKKQFKRVIKKNLVSIRDGIGTFEKDVRGYEYESLLGLKTFYRDEDMVIAMLEDAGIEIE